MKTEIIFSTKLLIDNVEVKPKDFLQVQEPTQKFSSDVYLFVEANNHRVILVMYNNDDDDGTIVTFPINKFKKCQVCVLQRKW